MKLTKKTVIIFFLSIHILCTPLFAQESQRKGEDIYKSYCATCHISGVANAPKAFNAEDWAKRSSNIDELVASTKKGLNVMPPKGLCADCTDQEFKAVIEYMKTVKTE